MSFRRASSQMMRWNSLRTLLIEESFANHKASPSSSLAASYISQPQALMQPLVSLNTFFARSFSSSSQLYHQDQPSTKIPHDHPDFPEVYVRLPEKTISGQYSIQPEPLFAVVEVGGTQYKVTPDDIIITEKLTNVDVNDTIKLQRVLMLGSPDETIIGRPYIPNASVIAAVEEQFLDGRVIIFHKRRRKNSRRTKGHRQPLTTLRILNIETANGSSVEEGDDQVASSG